MFLYPTEKGRAEKISQGFGERPEVYKQFGMKGHNGLDFGIPNGTLILAIGDGKVLACGDQGAKVGYGKYIKIQHAAHQSYYAHLQEFLVKVGDTVSAGQKIAKSDNTGFSTGAHLHLVIKQTDASGNVLNAGNGFGGAIDPLPLLEPAEVPGPTPHWSDPFMEYALLHKWISEKKDHEKPITWGELLVVAKRIHEDKKT
mgnify:CR=1 FL=1